MKRLDDTEIFELIVGRWQELRSNQGVESRATDTFRRDGTFSGEATLTSPTQKQKLIVAGSWKVEDGVLIETIEDCDPPFLTKGHVTKDQILSITDKELILTSGFGDPIVKQRFAEQR